MGTTTVSPHLPEFVKDTFEFVFLQHMIKTWVYDGGVSFGGPVWHDVGPSGFKVTAAELDDLVKKGAGVTSPLIDAIMPRLLMMQASGKPGHRIDFDHISRLVSPDGPDTLLEVDHFFHSLCQRFPVEIPFIETAWAWTDRKPAHGNFGGGASFMTADGIETMTSAWWLDQKREAFKASRDQAPATPAPRTP